MIWQEEAVCFVEKYLQWYEKDRSKAAADKFFDSVKINIERLESWPEIGRYEPKYTMRGFTVRSILIYEYYRILYGYSENEVVIIALWDMRAVK